MFTKATRYSRFEGISTDQSITSGKKDSMQVQKEFDIKAKNEDRQFSPIAQLFKLGRDKSYVTYEDILQFIPEPEKDLELVDRVFGVLLCADIPYGEDAEHLMDDEDIFSQRSE